MLLQVKKKNTKTKTNNPLNCFAQPEWWHHRPDVTFGSGRLSWIAGPTLIQTHTHTHTHTHTPSSPCALGYVLYCVWDKRIKRHLQLLELRSVSPCFSSISLFTMITATSRPLCWVLMTVISAARQLHHGRSRRKFRVAHLSHYYLF